MDILSSGQLLHYMEKWEVLKQEHAKLEEEYSNKPLTKRYFRLRTSYNEQLKDLQDKVRSIGRKFSVISTTIEQDGKEHIIFLTGITTAEATQLFKLLNPNMVIIRQPSLLIPGKPYQKQEIT